MIGALPLLPYVPSWRRQGKFFAVTTGPLFYPISVIFLSTSPFWIGCVLCEVGTELL
jgi:hypothetical protein